MVQHENKKKTENSIQRPNVSGIYIVTALCNFSCIGFVLKGSRVVPVYTKQGLSDGISPTFFVL